MESALSISYRPTDTGVAAIRSSYHDCNRKNHTATYDREQRSMWGGSKSCLLQRLRECVNMFDNHTLISEQDKSYMEISNPDIIHVVPNGIDTDFFSYGLADVTEGDLAFVGNMGYPPNEAAAVYITQKILPLLEQISLVISGARPTSVVQQLANDNVNVVGWVDDIREAYRRARIFLAPIFSGTGQQNKILEAMATGLPCITTTKVNNAIGAKDGLEILIADNPTEFAKAVKKLLNDNRLYNHIQHNARNFVVQKFSWAEHVAKLNDIITSNK